MTHFDEAYKRYEDEDGELYFCPVGGAFGDNDGSQQDVEDCIDAATVGRYAGHLHVIDEDAS